MARRRAMYDQACSLCSTPIKGQSRPFANDGEEVAKFLDKWVHAECMDARLAETESRTEKPEWRGWADAPSRTYVRRQHRQANIGRVKQQDGRDYKGRFASKPDSEV